MATDMDDSWLNAVAGSAIQKINSLRRFRPVEGVEVVESLEVTTKSTSDSPFWARTLEHPTVAMGCSTGSESPGPPGPSLCGWVLLEELA